VTTRDPRRAIEAVWRIEQAKLIAGIARLVRDVGLAPRRQAARSAPTRCKPPSPPATPAPAPPR